MMRTAELRFARPEKISRLVLTAMLAAAALTLAPAGCAVNPATGRTALTGFTTAADEARIGREQHPQIPQAFGGAYEGSGLDAYVNRIGQALARQTERTDVTYTFTILNSPIVNAIATPGGYVYITRGLLALADNEGEVASVLGHELGHITALHHAQQQSRQTLASLGIAALAIATGAPAALIQGTQLAALAYLRSFSREQEYEADQLGARYMARAGYDPRAAVAFLRKLQAYTTLQETILGQPGRAERFGFLATHPTTADRIESAIAAARVTVVANPTVGRDSYLEAIDGMLYGEPASQGYIRGRTFSHPLLRISFEVPPEYQLFNTQNAVFAPGPGEALIVFDAAPQPERLRQMTMAQYVGGAGRTTLNGVTAMRVNGLEAATGWVNVQTNRGPMELRLAAIRTEPARVYRFRFLTPLTLLAQLGPGNMRTIQSFRTLSPAEAAALKPLRVRVVMVNKGDTVAAMAKRMAFETYRAERFRVLNGLAPGAELTPGQRVKIITE